MQRFLDRMILRLPVFGDVIRKATIARWCRTLATMFAAGVPLVESLDSVAGAAGNYVYYEATKKIQNEVSTGTGLTVAMTNTNVFPNMVLQMCAIGEESGSLDAMLGKVADFFEQEVDEAVDSLSSLMEPMIMVVLGVTDRRHRGRDVPADLQDGRGGLGPAPAAARTSGAGSDPRARSFPRPEPRRPMDILSVLQHSTPWLAAVAGVAGLCIGSFLNVVIHRLPRMMEAQWKAECAALEGREAPAAETLNLVTPRLALPVVRRPDHGAAEHPARELARAPRALRRRARRRSARATRRSSCSPAALAVLCRRALRLLRGAAGRAGLRSGRCSRSPSSTSTRSCCPTTSRCRCCGSGLVANSAGLYTDLRSAVMGAVAGYLVLWCVYWGFRILAEEGGHGLRRLQAARRHRGVDRLAGAPGRDRGLGGPGRGDRLGCALDLEARVPTRAFPSAPTSPWAASWGCCGDARR